MIPVNVLGSERVRRELVFLTPQFRDLNANDLQKMYLSVAWRYVLEGDIEEALKFLDQISPEYVKDLMLQHMDTDPSFCTMVETVAKALTDANIYIPSYNIFKGGYVMERGIS
jgi:hypothetical protein